MATEVEIIKALKVLAAAYPNFELPKETVGIYCRMLVDLDYDTLRAATLQCVSVYKFFPTVAEIRSAVTDLRMMASGVPSASEAWGEVVFQFRETGSYSTPIFSHPIIGEVVSRFGWKNLCWSENQIADRARFIEAYNAQLVESRSRDRMLPEILEFVDRRLSVEEQEILEIEEKSREATTAIKQLASSFSK